ncbi:helix-turn-helix domain-containing protein [uncultured Kordia sp.]|uniref:helix-turn-helix domain-containing protein n=1 Tax=uncultured Kordia sp. TaxID=507699 RepID=UPI0026086C51|nr:helix-turn-helix domain-containing protein [uncultured Kordia sp.]
MLPSTLLLFCAVSFAQEGFEFVIPDSLQSKSYKELRAAFNSDRKDSIRRFVYAKSYVAKATKNNNRLEMTKGYELLGFAHNHNYKKSFIFYDKAIETSKDLKNARYPAILFTYKGAIFSEKGNYKDALENHLKAIEYAEANNNVELVYVNKHNIGILKRHLELYDEALNIFKECYDYELNDPNRDEFDFLHSHFSLADIYIETRVLDSAVKYNIAGHHLAQKLDKQYIKPFILNEGIINFHQRKYRKTIALINSVIDSLGEDIPKRVIMNGLFYTAKAYDSLQEKEKAIRYYRKVDSVFTMHPYNFSMNLMESYKALSSYYKTINDQVNEVTYIEKALLAYDAHNEDYRSLSNKIIKTFDRRDLLEKQKELNEALNRKDKKYTTFMIIFWIVFIVFMLALAAFYIKQRQIKKRFQEFVKNHEKTQKTKKKPIEIANEEVQKIGLADDIIDHLLSSLNNFETEHTYIKSDITLPSLSKQFKTNSAYLSKVINTYKNKKFAEYLNDLRVDYAIEKIQSDKHFHLYTIKAIALEVGFNNSQSFARAFKRKTGIKPSDFIRQLEKA